jgi:hypothetical protein
MSIHYYRRGEELTPTYQCCTRSVQAGDRPCQSIPGGSVDAAIGSLVVNAMTPQALEVALAVWQEVKDRYQEADRLRRQQVERAQYEADLARRRYMSVDPANRLVADSLEADWNDRLRALATAQEHYEHQKAADQVKAHGIDRQRVLSLVQDFPALWNDPRTPQAERKRMVRLLVEDVTLVKRSEITAHVRFRAGATTSLTLPLPLNAWQGRTTPQHVVSQIDELLEHHTDRQVATLLNDRGLQTGAAAPFTTDAVRWVRISHGLRSLKQRLQDKGWLPTVACAAQLGVHHGTLKTWLKKGLIQGRVCNDSGDWLFAPGQTRPPRTKPGRKPRSKATLPTQPVEPVAGGAV